MQSLVVDTNSVIKKLEQRGFSRAQAEGITEAGCIPEASQLTATTSPVVALFLLLPAPINRQH
jgi:hypothetical protein